MCVCVWRLLRGLFYTFPPRLISCHASSSCFSVYLKRRYGRRFIYLDGVLFSTGAWARHTHTHAHCMHTLTSVLSLNQGEHTTLTLTLIVCVYVCVCAWEVKSFFFCVLNFQRVGSVRTRAVSVKSVSRGVLKLAQHYGTAMAVDSTCG